MNIAKAFTGDPRRVGELVRFNPQKSSFGVGGVPTFMSLRADEKIRIPARWMGRGIGVGAAVPFRLVPAAVLVNATMAANACDFYTPSSWPSEMTTQAELIDNSSAEEDLYYILYKGKLYEFAKSGGVHLKTCSGSFDATKLTTPALPPGGGGGGGGSITPVAPGGATPVSVTTGGSTGTSTSSSWVPIALGAAALVVGVGVAYLVAQPPKSHAEIEHEVVGKMRERVLRRRRMHEGV